MLLIEAFAKFTNIGVMLILAALILKSRQNTLQTTLILFILSAFTCTLLTTGDVSLRINGTSALPLRLFDTINIVCLWLLGLSMFNDNFRIRRIHWAIIIIYLPFLIIARLYYMGDEFSWVNGEKVGIVTATISSLLMGHLAWTALRGRNEDLIEGRRKARIILSIAIVTLTLSVILVEQVAIFNNWENKFDLALYILYIFSLPITIGSVIWLTNFEPDALKFHKPVVYRTGSTRLDPKDQIAFNKLIDIIDTQRGFAEHGLTIGTLAEKLDLPAHQLRPLINNTLGYSNFSGFLNHYRIEEVKRGLSNPNLARTPILTLAIDAGFSTLSTFNRAFKMEVGVTPTDFRKKALDKALKDPINN